MTDDILRPLRVGIAVGATALAVFGCRPAGGAGASTPAPSLVVATVTPVDVYRGRSLQLGEPVAVAVDFSGRVLIADGSPGRIIRWEREGNGEREFQLPDDGAGFNPADIAVSGFFVYAVDEPSRRILRFDDQGAYRDILLNFASTQPSRRVSPYGLAVDPSGRVAVTDVENHQVLLFDSYLTLEVAFGNYGAYEGQLSAPRGVSFSPRGDIVVADTGNRRVQVFSDGGALLRVVPAAGADNPMRRPRRAVAGEDGTLYVADPGAGAVFVFAADGTLVRAVAVAGESGFAPSDVERSRRGLLYVTDEAARSVFVFEGV